MKEMEKDGIKVRNTCSGWVDLPNYAIRTGQDVREGLIKDLTHSKERHEPWQTDEIIEVVDHLFKYIKTGEK